MGQKTRVSGSGKLGLETLLLTLPSIMIEPLCKACFFPTFRVGESFVMHQKEGKDLQCSIDQWNQGQSTILKCKEALFCNVGLRNPETGYARAVQQIYATIGTKNRDRRKELVGPSSKLILCPYEYDTCKIRMVSTRKQGTKMLFTDRYFYLTCAKKNDEGNDCKNAKNRKCEEYLCTSKGCNAKWKFYPKYPSDMGTYGVLWAV